MAIAIVAPAAGISPSRITPAATGTVPSARGNARARWLAARSGELLPVPYFYTVFTLPHELSALVLQNKRLLYDLLFRTSAATLLEVARDPKHLGADIGLLSVLHTWGQNLQHHPHVHCVVPAGGLALDGSRWVAASSRFFLPVRVLSRVFAACSPRNSSSFYSRTSCSSMVRSRNSQRPNTSSVSCSSSSRRTGSSPPSHRSAEPKHVLNYLARYTHRVAISNHRLVSFKDAPRLFPLEGLRRWQQAEDHDRFSRRFPATIPHPRSTQGPHSHPSLRHFRQP